MWIFSSPFEEGEICDGCYDTRGKLVKEWMTGWPEIIRRSGTVDRIPHDTRSRYSITLSLTYFQ